MTGSYLAMISVLTPAALDIEKFYRGEKREKSAWLCRKIEVLPRSDDAYAAELSQNEKVVVASHDELCACF